MAFCALDPGFIASLKELLEEDTTPRVKDKNMKGSSLQTLAQYSGFTGKQSDSKVNTQLNVTKYFFKM